MQELQPDEVRHQLSQNAPSLWKEIAILAHLWISPAIGTLKRHRPKRPKTFNDPVWGGIHLYPWEVALVDTPLVQRLRGVRQLGLGHYVYPGATHNRFEHSIGVVEAAQRMITALERYAKERTIFRFGPKDDALIPSVANDEQTSIRLAALLHDIGHGPFSHASEPVLRRRLDGDFDAAEEVTKRVFNYAGAISTSEMLAVLLILSEPMRDVLTNSEFGATVQTRDLSMMIAARVVGSPGYLSTTYLSGIINGALDADKLDYMARDSHYSGLPLGLDLKRIISKIEVIGRTAAEETSPREPFRLGLAQAGLGAYEQMLIGRVFLYDRLYYHHKVRAADAMAYRLIRVAEEERSATYALSELMTTPSDEAFIAVVGGALTSSTTPSGSARSARIAKLIETRDLFHRAFVFGDRFLDGVPSSLGREADETRALIWKTVRNYFSRLSGLEDVAQRIYERASALAKLPIFADAAGIQPEDVIVDLAPSMKVTLTDRSNRVTEVEPEIYTRAEDGTPLKPNLFFDPEKWSEAYETQKHAGYVFTPPEFVPVVAVASRIIFFELFNVVVTNEAAKAAKTHDLDLTAQVQSAVDHALCSTECAAALTSPVLLLKRIAPRDLRIPPEWSSLDSDIAERLAHDLTVALDRGFPAAMHGRVINFLEHLMTFVTLVEETGKFRAIEDLSERELQDALRSHLKSRGAQVTEGSRLGGGVTDLMVDGIVIENKKRGRTTDPFASGPEYDWQARRYAIATASNIAAVVVAYRPAGDSAIFPLNQRLRIVRMKATPERRAHVRVVVPYGYSAPSAARAPEPD